RQPPPSPPFPYTTLFRSLHLLHLRDKLRAALRQFRHLGVGRLLLGPHALDLGRPGAPRRVRRKHGIEIAVAALGADRLADEIRLDRKSTRLNSSHVKISY